LADPSKTEDIVAITHQAVTHPGTVKGTEIDVSTKIAAFISMFHAMVEAAANTNPGKFLARANPSNADDDDWVTLREFQAGISTPDTEAMTATEPVDETVLAVVSTTGFAAEDNLYIQDTGTLADSEWAKCQEIVTNTSINLVDGLARQKDSSDVIWNDADIFHMALDVTAFKRLRVDFIHEGAIGANVHIKSVIATFDSFA
jgi:hypothetical protein